MKIKFSDYFQCWSTSTKGQIFINKLTKDKQTMQLELRVGFAIKVSQCFDIRIIYGKKPIHKIMNKQKLLYQKSYKYRQYRLIFLRIFGV